MTIKYIIFLFIIIYIISIYTTEGMTNLDIKSRKNSNCKPIHKININNLQIWIMPTSCEYGLPHTIGNNIIAIPNNYSINDIKKTIIHENVHLNQKKYPDIWKKFYKMHWNYEIFRYPHVIMPNSLITMRRSNPDTIDFPFARWKGIWWSVPVYKNINDLNFENCIVKWWNEKTNEIKLDPPKEWINFFGNNVPQKEHPYEISANYIEGYENNSIAQKILLNNYITQKNEIIIL